MFILHGCIGAGGAGVRGPGPESLKGFPDGQPYVDFAARCDQAGVCKTSGVTGVVEVTGVLRRGDRRR